MSYILAIESSCDDTSAAVLNGDLLLSNMIASQKVHEMYGGVVPELASRAHMQNIVPVVDAALKTAGIGKEKLDAIAFTRGPGLLGSLLVGVSFAKALSLSLHILVFVLAYSIGGSEPSGSPCTLAFFADTPVSSCALFPFPMPVGFGRSHTDSEGGKPFQVHYIGWDYR